MQLWCEELFGNAYSTEYQKNLERLDILSMSEVLQIIHTKSLFIRCSFWYVCIALLSVMPAMNSILSSPPPSHLQQSHQCL
jgi:hypothetical protein